MPKRCVDMQLQCIIDPVDHSLGVAKVPSDPIAWCHTADRVQRVSTTRQDVLHVVEDIIFYL
jgi:hypothetical protein